jgi:hypothetical protein
MQLASGLKQGNQVLDFPSKDQLAEKAIQEYQLPFGADYLRYKLGWSRNFADGAIAEYKRFVTMALRSDKELTPSEVVDQVRHYHILHTKDYPKFAEKIGHFLHHNPGTANEMPRFSRQYDQTLQFYKEVFSQEPPVDFWPRQSQTAMSEVDLKTASFSGKDYERDVILEARKHLRDSLSWEFFEDFRKFISDVEKKHTEFMAGNSRNSNSFHHGILHVHRHGFGHMYENLSYTSRMLVENFGMRERNFLEKFCFITIIRGGYYWELNSSAGSSVFRPLIKYVNELGYSIGLRLNSEGVRLDAKFLKR